MRDYKQLSENFVVFIDLLYAVVAGFAIDRYFRPVIEKADTFSGLFGILATQEFGFFFLAFFVVGRDWINYHVLVKSRPHKSIWRFLIDILILFTFVAMLQKINAISWFIPILVIYWFLLTIWSVIECIEYNNEPDMAKECFASILEDFFLLVSTLGIWFLLIKKALISVENSAFIPYAIIGVILLISFLTKKSTR
jgi:hypothetical protein